MPKGIPLAGKRIRRKPLKARNKCSIEGCKCEARSRGWCQKHYSRFLRHGDPSKAAWTWSPFEKLERSTGHGYITQRNSDHPLARNGRIYKHRKVLYDTIGEGPHPCHWCQIPLMWSAPGDSWRSSKCIQVDHVNSDKSNNTPDNLVPSCRKCNTNRGLFMSWVMKHQDDPFLLQLFQTAKLAGTS